MIAFRMALCVGLMSLVIAASTAAVPTPVPGGANEMGALPAKMGETAFNGVLRVKIVALRDAAPADNPEQASANASQKVMYFSVLLRNGSSEGFDHVMTYTLADKDDISAEVYGPALHPNQPNMVQGGAARQTAVFAVDKDFVPVKILVQCVTCYPHSFRPIRFFLPKE
jgi:hypothetical protein